MKYINSKPFGLSVKAAAPLIGVSQRTLRALIAGGKIRYVRVGSRVLLRPSDIEDFLENHAV